MFYDLKKQAIQQVQDIVVSHPVKIINDIIEFRSALNKKICHVNNSKVKIQDIAIYCPAYIGVELLKAIFNITDYKLGDCDVLEALDIGEDDVCIIISNKDIVNVLPVRDECDNMYDIKAYAYYVYDSFIYNDIQFIKENGRPVLIFGLYDEEEYFDSTYNEEYEDDMADNEEMNDYKDEIRDHIAEILNHLAAIDTLLDNIS